MSDKVTVHARVTLDIELSEIYVEALHHDAVMEKLTEVLNRHLGIHDYTFGPKYHCQDMQIEIDQFYESG